MSFRPPKHRAEPPVLVEIPLQWDDSAPLPENVCKLLADADDRLQAYWDQWHKRPIEQYVACDFRDVWHCLKLLSENQMTNGKMFCEWGSGFGIVTALASILGFEAIGIEAESFLVDESKKFLAGQGIAAEIWHGNFLPAGSQRLAKSQSHHASLFHNVADAYSQHDFQLDDFAVVFAYPWPGEDHFLQEVFRHYAADGALLLMFLGPYQVELHRKQ
jgi:SAM-dependent methyltransferase